MSSVILLAFFVGESAAAECVLIRQVSRLIRNLQQLLGSHGLAGIPARLGESDVESERRERLSHVLIGSTWIVVVPVLGGPSAKKFGGIYHPSLADP